MAARRRAPKTSRNPAAYGVAHAALRRRVPRLGHRLLLALLAGQIQGVGPENVARRGIIRRRRRGQRRAPVRGLRERDGRARVLAEVEERAREEERVRRLAPFQQHQCLLCAARRGRRLICCRDSVSTQPDELLGAELGALPQAVLFKIGIALLNSLPLRVEGHACFQRFWHGSCGFSSAYSCAAYVFTRRGRAPARRQQMASLVQLDWRALGASVCNCIARQGFLMVVCSAKDARIPLRGRQGQKAGAI